jgi:hypothetical protein
MMAKLVCPLCGSTTAPNPVTFEATVEVVDSLTRYRKLNGLATAVTSKAPGIPTYGVMQCAACKDRFVAKLDVRGEWLSVYPIPHREVAKGIPEPIRSEFEEAHLCFAVGAYRGCLSMCECVLEAMWRHQKAAGLNDLRDKGVISPKLFEQANEVRLWANVAKHELVHQPVSREDAEELLGYLEAVLDAVYVQPARMTALSQKRKQLEKGS